MISESTLTPLAHVRDRHPYLCAEFPNFFLPALRRLHLPLKLKMEAEKNLRPDENDSLEKGVRAEKDNVGSDHVVQSNPEYAVSSCPLTRH